MGTASPFAVATHTTTVPIDLSPVTVGFTHQETIVLTYEPVSTYEKTETTVSITTKTVTKAFTGSVFTTTSTVHVFDRHYENITTTYNSVSVSSEPYTINLIVPTIEGWMPINTTTSENVSSTTQTITLKNGRVRTTVLPVTATSGDAATITAVPSAGSTANAGSAPVTTIPLASPADQIIYILESGQLVPTPLTAVTGMISATQTPVVSVSKNTSDSNVAAGVNPTTADTPTEVTTIPGQSTETAALTPDQESEAELVKQLMAAMSSGDSEIAMAVTRTIPTAQTESTTGAASTTTSPTPPLKGEVDVFDDAEIEKPEVTSTTRLTATTIEATLSQRRTMQSLELPTTTSTTLMLRKRALTKVPKYYFGLRGNIMHDPTRHPPSYPTQVICTYHSPPLHPPLLIPPGTKSLIHETTIYAPTSIPPSFIAPTPSTRTTTTLTILTSTLTVPSPSPFKTATFVHTTTITTTTTHFHTTTSLATQVHTVSSTRTALAACATQNLLGPISTDDSHIVNLYSLGSYKYTSYDVGQARGPEECCVECHELLTPCKGSIWDHQGQRCFLVVDSRSECKGQGDGAGVFVTRPREERSGVGKHRWPEWVVSNGPCGFWVDGGTGW